MTHVTVAQIISDCLEECGIERMLPRRITKAMFFYGLGISPLLIFG